MTSSSVDLSQLALDRSPQNETTTVKRYRNRWFSRYVFPLGLVFGFVALLTVAGGRLWLPARSVTVVPVVVKRAEIQQNGVALFQAPGWIEPRPTAINVAALSSGVIEELLVVEGQQVEKGESIARLISIDTELILEQAKNTLAIRDGEVNRAKAELKAARILAANPVHLEVQLADAQSTMAKAQTELAKLPFLIDAAEANAQYAMSSMEGKRKARGAISDRIIGRSESEHAAADAELQELRSRMPNLQREVDALANKVDAIKRQIDLLVDETRRVEEAEAKLQTAEAMHNEGKLQLRRAELALERTIVCSPINGRVLRLIAAPGTRVMGLDVAAGHDSGTVIEMYDPNRLQVRVDVRLEDVPMVTSGQLVQIETASTKGVIQGRVLQVTSSANIQKNTLEVKVEMIDPPSTVSPEMLVAASFLAPVIENPSQDVITKERLFVPGPLVHADESDAFVWIVDENNAAQQIAVNVGLQSTGGLVEIKSGLKVTDKVIATGVDQLEPGNFVRVTGDDQSLGIN